jgi:hypothetical protein
MKVRKETIDKYVALLNSFISDQNLSGKERSYKYRTNHAVLSVANKLGLLKKVSRGRYLAVKSRYEPIDARNIALALNKHINHPKKDKEKQLEAIPEKNNETNKTTGIIKNARQSTIDRYLLFLNSYVTDKKITPNKRLSTHKKTTTYRVSAAASRLAVKIGLLHKNEIGDFVSVKEKYTEADAIKLSNYVSNITREGFVKSNLKKTDAIFVKKPTNIVAEAVEPPKNEVKPKLKVTNIAMKKPLRVFSLFWGLIKFNY